MSIEIHDLICVGMGPASLALAIALVEPSPNPTPTYLSLGGLQEALHGPASQTSEDGKDARGAQPRREERPLKACFIEKHDKFRWHPGMMLEGSTMQISFLKDLATLRNPQSAYTFLCYLASFTPSRLVSYISRETFTPSRREFADYMAWAARKVEGDLDKQGSRIAFGEEVVSVEAVGGEEGADIKLLKVTSCNLSTGDRIERFTRNIVLSTGGSPRIPQHLDTPDIEASGRVIHSSAFLDRISPALQSLTSPLPADRPLRIAVLGSGQSAAETFLALRDAIASHLPANVEYRPQVDLLIRGATLRPADDSASTNEVFDPGMSQAVYGIDETGRAVMLKEAKATNYSVANPKTLAAIYELLYAQQVEIDIATRDGDSFAAINRDPKLNIRPFTELVGARPPASSDQPLTLELYHSAASARSSAEYDVVVCGTGYNRQGWKDLLFTEPSSTSTNTTPLTNLFPISSAQGSPASSPTNLGTFPPSAFSLNNMHTTTHSRSSTVDTALFERSSRAPSSAFSSPPPSRASYSKERPDVPDFQVKKNYRLDLPAKVVGGGSFKPSVWLQGSCEATHGISDSLLSVLAVRSGEVVEALREEGWFGDVE